MEETDTDVTLANADEMRAVVSHPRALGRVFARHAYGMRRWVEVIGGRLDGVEQCEIDAIAALLVEDNARHALLFGERAAALGGPHEYRAPAEGEVIYERLERLTDPLDMAAFALGSLDHFSELLALYRSHAEGASATVIGLVAADVDEHRARLRTLLAGEREELRREAESLYEARELVEVGGYVSR